MTCWLAVLVPLFGLPGGPAPAPAPGRVVAAPPRVALSFPPKEHWYTLTLRFTTADGKTHSTGPLRIEQYEQVAARDVMFETLKDWGWAVEKAGTNTLVIRGPKGPDGAVTAVKSGKLTVRDAPSPGLVDLSGRPADPRPPRPLQRPAKPHLIGLGGATAENDVK